MDSSQKIVGFDIELVRYLARKLDLQLEIINNSSSCSCFLPPMAFISNVTTKK